MSSSCTIWNKLGDWLCKDVRADDASGERHVANTVLEGSDISCLMNSSPIPREDLPTSERELFWVPVAHLPRYQPGKRHMREKVHVIKRDSNEYWLLL